VDDTKVVFRQKQTTDDRNNEDAAKKSKEVAQKRGYSCKSLLVVATESIHNSDVRRKEGDQSRQYGRPTAYIVGEFEEQTERGATKLDQPISDGSGRKTGK
jgi:hypothetical protein